MKNTIAINGAPRVLRFDFESLCLMRERYGVNALARETYEPDPHIISVLVWGGLISELPKLTLQEVQKQLPLKEIHSISNLAVNSLIESLPEKAKDDSAGTS